MKKSRFSETQIVSILKEVDAGRPVKEVYRKNGVSDATYSQLALSPDRMSRGPAG